MILSRSDVPPFRLLGFRGIFRRSVIPSFRIRGDCLPFHDFAIPLFRDATISSFRLSFLLLESPNQSGVRVFFTSLLTTHFSLILRPIYKDPGLVQFLRGFSHTLSASAIFTAVSRKVVLQTRQYLRDNVESYYR